MRTNLDTVRDLISNSGYPQEVIQTALAHVAAAEDEVRELEETVRQLREGHEVDEHDYRVACSG